MKLDFLFEHLEPLAEGFITRRPLFRVSHKPSRPQTKFITSTDTTRILKIIESKVKLYLKKEVVGQNPEYAQKFIEEWTKHFVEVTKKQLENGSIFSFNTLKDFMTDVGDIMHDIPSSHAVSYKTMSQIEELPLKAILKVKNIDIERETDEFAKNFVKSYPEFFKVDKVKEKDYEYLLSFCATAVLFDMGALNSPRELSNTFFNIYNLNNDERDAFEALNRHLTETTQNTKFLETFIKEFKKTFI